MTNKQTSPMDVTKGASPMDVTKGASPMDVTKGASPMDVTKGASPMDVTKGASPMDTLNATLEKAGAKPVVIKDTAPEATKYHAYRNGDGDRDQKKYDRLRSAHLRNFYKYIAKQYPHLLFESDIEKVYFVYNKETGIYEDWSDIRVKEMVTRTLINEGFKTEAKITMVRQIIIDMRSMFPERGCHFNDFDNQDDWFHCDNGWVRLSLDQDGKNKDGTLKYKDRVFEDHTPDRLSRRVSAVAYEASAECPYYDKMMNDFKLADDMVRVIDQFSGLLLTNDIKHQKMLAFIGKPGCGKSTIAETWGKVLGDMSLRKDLGDLSGDRFRFIGASLVGRTFIHFDEVDIKRSEMGSNLGNLITGDTFSVERKGENQSPDVKNKLKCVLTANSLPMSAEVGIFRRMILIEFTNSFYDNGNADLRLPEKLDAESSGILNRMLKGLADIRMAGTFTVIAGHDDAIEEYKVSSNTIAEYLEEYFIPSEDINDAVPVKVMFNTYVKWLGQNRGRMTLTPQRFGQMIKTQPLRKFNITAIRGTGGKRLSGGLKVTPGYKIDEIEEVLEVQYTPELGQEYADNDPMNF